MLEPLLPKPRTGRPPKWTKRQLVDGIRWRVRVGSPWRDVPACYGPWQTVHRTFCRWQRDGAWARVVTGLQALADAAGLITWDVSVDSTVARAHQHAAGARTRSEAQRQPPGGLPSSRPTTRWGVPGVAGPRSCMWLASSTASRCLCW
ncbi:MAG TPA: transposase [Micromonosporaceae bacterium]